VYVLETSLKTPDELRQALLDIGEVRYHSNHPFHKLLHAGKLDQRQVQAWALNRFYYQSAIPRKDAALMARTTDPDIRRAWRQRIVDHDGAGEDDGGIRRWLYLTDAVGLDRQDVLSHRGVLPATKFAVEAYVRFVSERSLLEAIASSLTELFAPKIISERVKGMLEAYPFVDARALAYFDHRMHQAPRDCEFALGYVLEHADTAEKQAWVLDALRFKCDVLWSQLDALYHAYVTPGHVPPGCFGAAGEER
jgi:pyrroloquinoline-quinone synthase